LCAIRGCSGCLHKDGIDLHEVTRVDRCGDDWRYSPVIPRNGWADDNLWLTRTIVMPLYSRLEAISVIWILGRREVFVDQLDPVAVRVGDEADAADLGPAGGRVGWLFWLDPLGVQLGQQRVEVLDHERQVVVAVAEVVGLLATTVDGEALGSRTRTQVCTYRITPIYRRRRPSGKPGTPLPAIRPSQKRS
jgi:hypothetical protein